MCVYACVVRGFLCLSLSFYEPSLVSSSLFAFRLVGCRASTGTLPIENTKPIHLAQGGDSEHGDSSNSDGDDISDDGDWNEDSDTADDGDVNDI